MHTSESDKKKKKKTYQLENHMHGDVKCPKSGISKLVFSLLFLFLSFLSDLVTHMVIEEIPFCVYKSYLYQMIQHTVISLLKAPPPNKGAPIV